jgi:Ca-activated chloride channel family protein
MNKLHGLFCLALIAWPLAAQAEPRASAPAAQRAEPAGARAERRVFSADAAQAGVLLLRGQTDESTWLAPIVSNVVELRVTGMIARAEVKQVFENPSDDVVEAVYVFPLPETAAVDALTLEIGERRIVGEVQEREKAERVFERARQEGKKAALVEQARPNLFSTRVANIGPGETVSVALEYQQDVTYDAGQFSLYFPSTLTPRYLPGSADDAPGGSAERSVKQRDAARITPPFVQGDGPSLELTVELDAGFPVAGLISPSHAIDVSGTPGSAGPLSVNLSRGAELADRDFRLEWRLKPDRAPHVAVFEEEFKGQRFALIMAMPPQPGGEHAPHVPREAVFVIDTSGSMAGTSIEGARRALEGGLDRLRPSDHFNVIEFNSEAHRLFDQAEPASPANLDVARGWVRSLVADGGTEMLPALQLALGTPGRTEQLGQVVFITDGSVGNESELFQFIQDNLHSRRMFTVGIGSAPNHHFMRSAAHFGRGSFTYVADPAEVAAKMGELWRKLDAPAVTDLALRFGGTAPAEIWPERLPDLYRGEPLVILAKLDPNESSATLLGKQLGQNFTRSLELNRAGFSTTPSKRKQRGVHRLWARRKIEGLMDRVIEGTPEEQIRPRVTALALEHHLVSKYTSLVAVDKTRSVDAPGHSVAVANAVPAGNAMFGNLPSTATPGPTCLLLSLLSFTSAWWVRRRGS